MSSIYGKLSKQSLRLRQQPRLADQQQSRVKTIKEIAPIQPIFSIQFLVRDSVLLLLQDKAL